MTDRKRGIARGSNPPEPSEPQGSIAVAAIRSVQALLDARSHLHPLPLLSSEEGAPPEEGEEGCVDEEIPTLVR